MSGSWILLSVLAAAIWGLEYTFTEKVMIKGTPLQVAFWMGLIQLALCVMLSLLTGHSLAVRPLVSDGRWPAFVAAAVLGFAGGLSITGSIKLSQNATASSMIEITYPFFVAFFSFLLFRQNQFSVGTTLGGVLIVLGVWLVGQGR